MDELRVLSPTAILGYGSPIESLREGMRRQPHVIAVDAGSTDPGPYYLGAGKSFTDRNSVKRDLEIMISAGLEAGIPVVIGTAGGSGGRPHVALTREILLEIGGEKGLSFRLAVIQSELDKEMLRHKLARGDIQPLRPAGAISAGDIDVAERIVAQMGEEPIMAALGQGAQVVLAGRAYDPSVFAALALMRGYDKGLAIHMGKILECAAIAALPGSGSDCMFGRLRRDCFILETLSEARKCTALSVAAHTLYEKSNPYELPGPGGAIHLYDTRFTQISESAVRVTGSRFVPTDGYFLKLEGVRKVGYRTVSIAGVKDPVMIEKIEAIIEGVKERVRNNFADYGIAEYFLDFKIYGKNGVMALFPGLDERAGHELAIVIEAVAADQESADTVCGFARSTLLHFGYEGRVSTAGNLALPFSPSDFRAGAVYEFSIYHLMRVDDPTACFPITFEHVGGS